MDRELNWDDKSSVCIHHAPNTDPLDFPTVAHDCVIKGLGISSLVCATGHKKEPLPFIMYCRALCHSGAFHSDLVIAIMITTLI